MKFAALPLEPACMGQSSANCASSQSSREKALMASGLLTKNSACVMCHTKVSGTVMGFGSMTFRDDSMGQILGNVYAADIKLQRWVYDTAYHLDSSFVDTDSDPSLIASALPELASSNVVADTSGHLHVRPGEKHNTFLNISFLGGGDFYSLTEKDPTKRAIASDHLLKDSFGVRPVIHESDFPKLNPLACIPTAQGTFRTADGSVIQSPVSGNLILANGKRVASVPLGSPPNSFNDYDPSCPASKTLTISGEVVVKGDVVISGCIKGQGTLYATGNIYIPDDVKLVNSPFPFAATADENILKPEALSKLGKDMFSLGSAQFIVIGPMNMTVLANGEQDPIFSDKQDVLTNVYKWLSTGTTGQNQALYESSFLKRAPPGYFSNQGTNSGYGRGAVSLLQASLYANLGISAVLIKSQNTNLIIDGSVMTPNFVMLSTAFQYQHYDGGNNFVGVNPFNGQSFEFSQLNQDQRLKFTRNGYECLRSQLSNKN